MSDAPVRVMVVDDHPMWRDGVARDLTEAGFTGVMVRRARPDDPARTDAVVYAAAVGAACILVYQVGWDGPGGERIVGKRSDGNCLAP